MPHGDITHLELPVSDFGKSREFYTAVFGWQPAATPGFDNYETFQCPSGATGGALTPREDGFTQPRIYVEVDSIDDAVAATTATGGTVVQAKGEITPTSWWAVVADPEGNELGLFEGMIHAEG